MNHDNAGPAGEDSTRGEKTFEILLKENLENVFILAFRMLGSRSQAGEVTRAVFLRGSEAGEIDATRLRHRLYRFTVQECIARIEQEKRAGEYESLETVERVLLKLRPESRAVVLLKHFCGCSYVEIGRILRMKERTVKRRLFDARRRLLELGLLRPTTRASTHDRRPRKRTNVSRS